MKNLFKLKKDGKTVGYLELFVRTPYGYPVLWFRNKEWHSGNNVQADSVHPFVTKDKNGKDVFAGDTVRSGKRVLTIVWDKCDMQWKTKQPGRTSAAEYYLPNTPLCQWAISEQFELIEDKEDA